jgi:hypothetical protein
LLAVYRLVFISFSVDAPSHPAVLFRTSTGLPMLDDSRPASLAFEVWHATIRSAFSQIKATIAVAFICDQNAGILDHHGTALKPG